MGFKYTARRQYRRIKRGFSNYGIKDTHEIAFDRDNVYDKAYLLLTDLTFFLVLLGIIMIVTFALLEQFVKKSSDSDKDNLGNDTITPLPIIADPTTTIFVQVTEDKNDTLSQHLLFNDTDQVCNQLLKMKGESNN
ncbi:hypothetical protein SNEBB_000522 [Seison nebaliae]|nr:hypothetical protein SNEBB_000522 [Seison nebaliae]